MAQLLAIRQFCVGSVPELLSIKFLVLFSAVNSGEASAWRAWWKVSRDWEDYNLSVFASSSELFFLYGIVDFEIGHGLRMKIWSFSEMLSKDSAPYNLLVLTFQSFEFYSARLLTLHRCGKITDEGIKNLAEGLKRLCNLQSIDLDFTS